MGVEEAYPILDNIEMPPAKRGASRSKHSDLNPIQTEKRVSLETNGDSRFDDLRALFSTPSLMNGENSRLYGELYRQVEEAVQPKRLTEKSEKSEKP